MTPELDVAGLAHAYRRLVLWFGAQLILAPAQLILEPLLGDDPAGALLGLAILAGALATIAALAYYASRTARALGSGVAWLWGVAMLVPAVNTITLLVLSARATRACRANGVPVGLFGPKVATAGEDRDTGITPE